jgi:tRNA threonylcarbamoyladenosine modification (KEOPS) complex  Pcc1 subunit
MPYHIATIEILIDAENDAEVADAIAESLRPLLREFTPRSSVVDWRYAPSCVMPEPHTGAGFEYA